MLSDIPGKRLENEIRVRNINVSHALMEAIGHRLENVESTEGKVTILFSEAFNSKMRALSVGRSDEPGHITEASFYRRPEGLRGIDPNADRPAFFLGMDSIGKGVTFGGVRLLCAGNIAEARRDAKRLSEAMTHKLSMIGEPYGGSKMVVLAPETGKSETFLHKIGQVIEALNGMLIAAIDFGFEPQDALKIRERTRFILGFDGPESLGASGVTTALGAFEGMGRILTEAYGSPQIAGRSFAIQGVGSVGGKLAELILESKGTIFITDTDEKKLGRFRGIGNVTVTEPGDILLMGADVLCPSGPACVINPTTIEILKSRVIAGVANCVLEDELRDDRILRQRGILFAPDFVLNAGGVMQGIEEFKGNGLKDAIDKLPIIPKNLDHVFRKAKRDGSGTMMAAKSIAMAKRTTMERTQARTRRMGPSASDF